MSTHDELNIEEHHHPNYFGVFIALAVLTALITTIELMSQAGIINWPRPVLNASYLTMSVVKALLVVLYYMHLKFDSFVYTVLFGLPVVFAIFFFFMLLV